MALVLQVPLWALDRPWLKVDCGCGRSVAIPASQAVRGVRDERVLGAFVDRLTCKRCGGKPVRITLDDTGNAFAIKAIGGRRIWLVGRE